MGLRYSQTPEERAEYCRAVLERHREIATTDGGNILILDIENYRKNEKSFSQIGWIEVRYVKGAWGRLEARVDSVAHYVVSEHRPRTVRQSPVVPVQERSLAWIKATLKARFASLSTTGKRTLLLAHAADNDLKCLENVFEMPMSLFRADPELPDQLPLYEVLDTQTLFANVLNIHKSVRLCVATWAACVPALGNTHNSGNFHSPVADCHYTFALYLRLIEALTQEFGH